jgi:hypothetical protein
MVSSNVVNFIEDVVQGAFDGLCKPILSASAPLHEESSGSVERRSPRMLVMMSLTVLTYELVYYEDLLEQPPEPRCLA